MTIKLKYMKLLREDAVQLINTVEQLEIELEAYRQALAGVRLTHVEVAPLLDELLVAARQDTALLALMKGKYDAIRDTFRKEEIETVAQEEIDRLIERLQLTDLIKWT